MIASGIKATLKDVKVNKQGVSLTFSDVVLGDGNDLTELAENIMETVYLTVREPVQQTSIFDQEVEAAEESESVEGTEEESDVVETAEPEEVSETDETAETAEASETPKPMPFYTDDEVAQELGVQD